MRPINSWQDIEDRGGRDALTPAERKLIDACKAGEECVLGDGKLPPDGAADPAREIRAPLLRYLILGGCDACPVRGWGVQLIGGHVTGKLDLSFAKANGITDLTHCRFEARILALQAGFEFLNLSNSALPGLNLQGTNVAGNLFVRGITAIGEVSLGGAVIGGQLSCTGATFTADEAKALNAQGARVAGGVFLDSIIATGEVRLSGADITGQLDCVGATFQADKGDALNAQRLRVSDSLIWRNVTSPRGDIRFTSAHVGDLVHDVPSWPEGGRLILDGFTYDRISGAFTNARHRIDWLEKGTVWNGVFFPQPFTHLASVLRGMGHEVDAQKVLVRRDQRLGEFARRRAWRNAGKLGKAGNLFGLPIRLFFDRLYRYVAGYGHRPFRSLGWLIGLIFVAGVFAHLAYTEGSFAPNSGPVLVSQDWQSYAGMHGNPAAMWSADDAPGRDWETFHAGAWAADLVIPIIDLGQTDAWAPSTTRGPWGRVLWGARWGFILAGWIVTALGAAALTGLISRK